jgi:hypothetical protein
MWIFNSCKPTKKIAGTSLLLVTLFTQTAFAQTETSTARKCDSIPPLNKRIVDFAQSKLHQKVGMGECWDLAAEALEAAGAKWNHEYKFGRLIDISKECIYVGDIIQFEKVKIDYKENNTHYRESLPHHTAIVYEIEEQDEFTLIEQNTGRLGEKVGLSPLQLRNIKAGKYKIYRPVN